MNSWLTDLCEKALGGLNPKKVDEARNWAKAFNFAEQTKCLPAVLTVADAAKFWCALKRCWEQNCFPLLGNPSWGEVESNILSKQFPGYWRINDDGIFSLEGAGKRPFIPPKAALLGIATGGSGGDIRFALHGEDNLRVAAWGYNEWLGPGKTITYSVLPSWHVSGFMPVVRALETKGELCLAEAAGLEALLTNILRDGAKDGILSLVPTQLFRLLRKPEMVEALRHLKAVLVGGAQVASELGERCARQGIPLQVSYGATETAALIAAADESDKGGRWIFKALPHAQIVTVSGEVVVESAALSVGYWGDTKGLEGKWFSGDLGEMADENRFRLKGRKRRLINTGGEKVDPSEVERVIRTVPGVGDCWVEAFPDPEWGESLFAVWTGDPSLDLRSTLRSKLATHKIPRTFIHSPESPLDGKGKFPVVQWREKAREGWGKI